MAGTRAFDGAMGMMKPKQHRAKPDLVARLQGDLAADGDAIDKCALPRGKRLDGPPTLVKCDAGVAKGDVFSLAVPKSTQIPEVIVRPGQVIRIRKVTGSGK